MSSAPLDLPLGPEDHVSGPADAPYELVMYGDFQCPYCVAAQAMVRRARERLDGRLRFAFRHLPLRELHPFAQKAAEAVEAAAAQGAFWPFADALYADQGRLDDPHLWERVRALGLDLDRFERDRRRDEVLARVRGDTRAALAAGATATPTLFCGERALAGAPDPEWLRRLGYDDRIRIPKPVEKQVRRPSGAHDKKDNFI